MTTAPAANLNPGALVTPGDSTRRGYLGLLLACGTGARGLRRVS